MINRLSRILVRNGFGDLKVKVGEVEITCVRSILMNGNATIRKLLLDEKQSELLELYERCDINSFLEIEKYYSGGCMELSENNVCDILRFSIYYNDNRIMLICKKYLKNHMNESIMIEIFSILNGLNIQKLNDLKGICEDYIRMNGYNYLNEDSLLLKLNLISIKFILNNESLIIDDESWLFNRLMLWYREVLKSKECNYEDKEEEREEFVSLIKTKIHLNEIDGKDLSEENLQELNNLKISINDYAKNHIKIKMNEVKNADLKKIIHKYYLKEIEESEEMKMEENDLEKLKSEEMKNEMIKLLYNEDMKKVEIVLIIIMEMRISEIIPKEIKNKLLGRICCEYIRNKRKYILKCLCLFVDDNKYISTIECLCGKEILYEILNLDYYLNSKSKEFLIQYIQGMKLNEKEEEEMSKIIMNKELSKELLIKEITSFSYLQSEYSFGLNEEISLIPSFDGTRCEFSVFPSLPLGLTIDKESGIIHGKVEKEIEKNEYEISCKNVKSEKKFRIILEIIEVKFTELNKGKNVSISNNGKRISSSGGSSYHCYLNLKMENGIYHIKYKYSRYSSSSGYDSIYLGLSTNNTFSGTDIDEKPTTCNYYAHDGKSQDITRYCHIGTIVNINTNTSDKFGCVYEVIVDMNRREFSISNYESSSPILLLNNLPSPLYPYAAVHGSAYIELLYVSHKN